MAVRCVGLYDRCVTYLWALFGTSVPAHGKFSIRDNAETVNKNNECQCPSSVGSEMQECTKPQQQHDEHAMRSQRIVGRSPSCLPYHHPAPGSQLNAALAPALMLRSDRCTSQTSPARGPSTAPVPRRHWKKYSFLNHCRAGKESRDQVVAPRGGSGSWENLIEGRLVLRPAYESLHDRCCPASQGPAQPRIGGRTGASIGGSSSAARPRSGGQEWD